MSANTIVCVIGAGISKSFRTHRHSQISLPLGFHGLIAARRFLQLYPTVGLTIFEADHCLGGVWNRERVYDELLTESSVGMYEYSDEPVICDQISGKHLSVYLENYARKHNLYQRIQFNNRVINFTKSKTTDRWQLEIENQVEILECDKLIVATGLTSAPSIPIIPTGVHFSVPQYHVRSLAKLKISSNDQHVLVIGGAKSAYDAAYTMVKQGAKHVTLVVKDSGPGPAWLIPDYFFSKVSADKLISTRLVATLFNPNIWSSNTYVHFLFHQTTLGKMIVKNAWQLAEEIVRWYIGYEHNENLRKLSPSKGSLFWSSTNSAVLNHPDILEMIKEGRIEVKRSTIVELKGLQTVCFADGTELDADLLIWATGWKPPLFPFTSTTTTTLAEEAEAYVLRQCPLLGERLATKKAVSFPLYRRLVPLDYIHDHSIVYVGMLLSANTGIMSEVQAVWSALYLMREFQIADDASWEIAVTNAWLARRYPIVERHSNYTHDVIQYAELLLKDLGLNGCRKKSWHWWREIFETYQPCDYKGLVEEWHAVQNS